MLLINCEINLILTWPANCYFCCSWSKNIFNKRNKTLRSCNQPIKSDIRSMKLLEKLVQVKEMIIQLVAYLIIITSNKITRQLILLEI